MKLVIILSKEVETAEQGQQLFDIVKARYAEQPDIKVIGNVKTSLTESES